MPTDARRCAYAVVRRVFEQDAYADRAFRAEADRLELDGRDRAFAMSLAYGVVQRRATLDHVIESLSDRAADRIDAPVLAALRLGVHQLLFMDGVADHAAVAESVDLTKAARSRGHGFVNAVLRRTTREGRALVDGLGESSPAEAALRHSHPRVGGAGLVGSARAARRGGPDAHRQRAGRERGAREHVARDP